jgi:hypothetical protein
VNKSASPERRGMESELIMPQFVEDGLDVDNNDRELTPITRQPNVPTAKMNFNQPLGPHESVKKIGLSQIIKYLDLSKFKIEKCKNLTNGRQHNHKHCRYYHTAKDKRRVLDYIGYSQILAGKFHATGS